MRKGLVLLPLCAWVAGCGNWGFFSMDADHKDRRTPLQKAAQEGDLATVQHLLASGADPNDRAGTFGSPLNSAALRNGNAEVIRALISAGANPNGRGEEAGVCWASPLLHAAASADLPNLRTLLELGAKPQDSGCSKLVVGWLEPPVIDFLRQHGLDLLAVNELGQNELHIALAPPVTPKPTSVEYLIKAGVPLNSRDRSGKTPMAYWREPRHFQIHRFQGWLVELLSGGDDLIKAERDNHAKISRLLASAGAHL